MFWIVPLLVSSKKFDISFAIKYTSSCPCNNASMLVVNRGKYATKGIFNTTVHVRLPPGKHHVAVSHAWCDFYPMDVDIDENGVAKAVANGTVYKEQPFKIYHPKMIDQTDPIAMMFQNSSAFLMIGGFILFQVLMRKFCSPERVQKMQEELKKQQEELMRQEQLMQQQQQRQRK